MDGCYGSTSIDLWLFTEGIKIMSNSKVNYINHSGSDQFICECARVTTGSDSKEVRGLINYLMRNGHTSPFEFASMIFDITMPIFVARQFVRHRMANYSEVSMRYTKQDGSQLEFYSFDGELNKTSYTTPMDKSKNQYMELLKNGIKSEKARAILPLSTMTTIRVQMNLRSLMNFLKQRLDKHAQEEIQVVAQLMENEFKKYFPITHQAFEDYILNSVTFTAKEMKVLSEAKILKNVDVVVHNMMTFCNMSENEKQEFLDKINIIIHKN